MLATRTEVVKRLNDLLPGRNLYELAAQHQITVNREGRLNKGWVGQTIERVANLTNNSNASRDGEDFELKSTTLVLRSGAWTPKETIRITQLNPSAILDEEFETSALWNKLARLVIVGCRHDGETEVTAIRIAEIDIADPELVGGIRTFWEDIRHIICSGEITQYHDVGRSDDWIQLRPTGTGKELSVCPITGDKFPSRAFYATKRLLRHVLL